MSLPIIFTAYEKTGLNLGSLTFCGYVYWLRILNLAWAGELVCGCRTQIWVWGNSAHM